MCWVGSKTARVENRVTLRGEEYWGSGGLSGGGGGGGAGGIGRDPCAGWGQRLPGWRRGSP